MWEDINSWTKDLSFTLELGINQQNFPDLLVYKGECFNKNRIFDLKLYVKPTNLHLFTDPSSHYPAAYKFSWITGEQIRIIRNSSSVNDYLQSLSELKDHLTNRGYSKDIQHRYLKLTYSKAERARLLDYATSSNETIQAVKS